MDVLAKAAEGDRVRVLLGWSWHPATVKHVGRWSHHSGNSYLVYTVRFDGGGTLHCGNNSLRAKGER